MILWIEVTHPLGRKEVMSLPCYVGMAAEHLQGTKARLMTRAEFVAYLQRRRLARGIEL